MYAQAVRTPPRLRRGRRIQSSAFEQCAKGCAFSDVQLDCIKYLKLGDPACGSGNFLTETYLCLRRLENRILTELTKRQINFVPGDLSPIQVKISQFYGIEINGFAVAVAKTALWIAESQMWKETKNIIQFLDDFLPLENYENIIEANALTLDWADVVKPSELKFIMGNPPFVGASMMTGEQKSEAVAIFRKSSASKFD